MLGGTFPAAQAGAERATRPESTKAQALRILLISVASVVCLVAAAGVTAHFTA